MPPSYRLRGWRISKMATRRADAAHFYGLQDAIDAFNVDRGPLTWWVALLGRIAHKGREPLNRAGKDIGRTCHFLNVSFRKIGRRSAHVRQSLLDQAHR